MAQIIAPNKDYNGESASVTFVKGVGETSDAYLIEWFKEHGYTVIDDEAAEVQPVTPEEAPAADVETEEQSEETQETQEKPKRSRSSRAKAADAE
ncbi:MAG: hypothetical protein ACLVHE_02110 [Dialister invisus]|uniref:hypothetical protein n=1 Tax=Dialister invisus TaxID=218538 RepID=UPI00399B70CC